MTILLDFESQSRADLKRVGGRNYWAHPSSRALCVAWYDVRTDGAGVWFPGEPWPHAGRELAAHNMAGFDRHACVRYGMLAPDDLGEKWLDTSVLARRAGLPGALDELGTRWCNHPKDKEASRFTNGLSSVRRPRDIDAATWRGLDDDAKRERGALPVVDDAAMARVVPYCLDDVDIMARAWPRLESWRGVDNEVLAADRIVNERGVYFDQDLARALLAADERNTSEALDGIARGLGWSAAQVRQVANSPKQFTAYTGLLDATAATIDDVLTNAAHGRFRPHVIALAKARRALASIARGKLEAGLARVSPDSRLRDSFLYYGAHTGRWSGRGMQLQNMPRPDKRFEKLWEELGIDKDCVAIDRWIEALAAHAATAKQDEIDLLLRATICAKPGHVLAVCDFSGVEARALAWAAGDRRYVETFRSGKDVYKVEASNIFGTAYDAITSTQRKVGKEAVLALGYGMGGPKYEERVRAAGVDPDEARIDCPGVVKAWRKAHAPIAYGFWPALEAAFVEALDGHQTQVGPFTVMPSDDGRDLAIVMPSGRPIVYNDATVHDRDGRPSLAFMGTHGPEFTYGGKLAENVIQGACRCMMADCLVRAEAAGLNPVLTAHDEIACEVPESSGAEAYATLHQVMTTLPDCYAGFPTGAVGFHGRRYRK
jgi:DNA polymerase